MAVEPIRIFAAPVFMLALGCTASEPDTLLEPGKADLGPSPAADIQRAPDWNALMPLGDNTATTAVPIVVSNNPETFDGHGLLLGTLQPSVASSGARTTSRAGAGGEPLVREWSGGSLQAGCPAGALRSFSVFAHHIDDTSSGSRVSILLSPAGGDARIDAWGAATTSDEAGGWQLGANTAYRLSRDLLEARHNVREEGRSLPAGRVHVLTSRDLHRGESFDARVRVEATEGCVYVRVVAAPPGSDATTALTLAQGQFATGDVQCPGCRASYARGTPAGVYAFDRFDAQVSADIETASGSLGWRFDSLAQAAPAVAYYRANNATHYEIPEGGRAPSAGGDSDDVSWANYGADYHVEMTLHNRTGSCVRARGALMVYPGTRSPDTAAGLPNGWLWNGWGVGQGYLMRLLVHPQRSGAGTRLGSPLHMVCDGASCSGEARLQAGTSHTVRVHIPVPSLISAPAGLVFTHDPC